MDTGAMTEMGSKREDFRERRGSVIQRKRKGRGRDNTKDAGKSIGKHLCLLKNAYVIYISEHVQEIM